MTKVTVLITGGTSGIGKATATLFAREGHRVFITAREAAKGQAVVEGIIVQTGNQEVQWIQGDLSTIKNCQALVQRVLREVPSLQVLINNAGVFITEKVLNADGFETNFMVNYLAPFILSTGLVELLAQNAHARIISVNTGLHVRGHFDLAKTPYGLDFDSRGSYRNAKLANALFTVEMAQRVRATGVTVNAFRPGLYNTTVFKVKGVERLLFRCAGFIYELFHPIAGSAQAPYYLATAPNIAHVTGAYFSQQKLASFAEQTGDAKLRQQLWEQTEKWIGS